MTTGIYKSISDQTGNFGFQFGVTSSDLTKNINIGLSGVAPINFNLLNGRIYDNSGLYVGSYLANQQTLISGNVSSNSFDYYLNGEIIASQVQKNTGVFNSIYMNTDSGNSVNFSNYIVGQQPAYTITSNILFVTGNLITGQIINNSNGNFRIFSGLIDNTNFQYQSNITGDIGPNQTGQFTLSYPGANAASSYSGNVTLNTNFGNITQNVVFNSLLQSGPYTQFNYNQNNFSGISATSGTTGVALGGVSFFSVSGNNYVNTPLDIQLLYISGGTGNFINSWNLETGIDINSMTNFKNNSYFDSNHFYNPNGITNTSVNGFFTRVSFSPNATGINVAGLLFTGLNTGILINITGVGL